MVERTILTAQRVTMRACARAKAWDQSRSVTALAGAKLQPEYEAVVIGGGHNGLVAAAYLSRAGVRTTVLERRNLLGGASVTEEIVPGFKFSRASYLLSLLRPQIYEDLQLKRHGLTLLPRPYLSFCPLLDGTQPGHYLLLGSDMQENQKNIAQFSRSDAQMYPDYVQTMERFVTAMDPLLDSPLPDIPGLFHRSPRKVLQALKGLRPLLKTVRTLGKDIPSFLEILTAPSAKILNRWFESELLKAVLATDSVVGSNMSPYASGSGASVLPKLSPWLLGTILDGSPLRNRIPASWHSFCRPQKDNWQSQPHLVGDGVPAGSLRIDQNNTRPDRINRLTDRDERLNHQGFSELKRIRLFRDHQQSSGARVMYFCTM